MEIGGSTRVFALLGNPVAHTLSPAMHNAGFRALGLDAVYLALACEAAQVEPLMLALARQGGGGNVTIPHKAAAAEAVRRHGGFEPEVCNTFWSGEGGTLRGAETDSVGIGAAWQGLGAQPGAWCIIGTGGSARAALRAAKQAGAAVAVQSRSQERAERLAELARAAGLAAATPAECQVVVNCTPLGLTDGDPLPLPPGLLPGARVALDLVYRRGETAWVHAMRHAGARAADGREVLVGQGAAAFEHWFPGTAAPREVMRAAVAGALA